MYAKHTDTHRMGWWTLTLLALVMLAAPLAARADVAILSWTQSKVFRVGQVVRHTDNRIYKCIQTLIDGTTNQPPDANHWTVMPQWATGQTYAVGDLVSTGNPSDVYRCTTQHTSDANNGPPGDNWQKPMPLDPPVETGGHGPAGDDWIDYLGTQVTMSNSTLWYRAGTTNGRAQQLAVLITVDNPNFTTANNKLSDGTKLAHICFWRDYDGTSLPSSAQGNAFFDWSYALYQPAVNRVAGSSPTSVTNCHAYSFDQYAADGTRITNWIEGEGGGNALPKVKTELHRIKESGEWGTFDTIAGDRCLLPPDVHVWNIVTSPAEKAATNIKWKNNSSALYTWSHSEEKANNCAPVGAKQSPQGPVQTKDLYETFEIWNKTDR